MRDLQDMHLIVDGGGGPNNIANADAFNVAFIPDITSEGLKIIHSIIAALIIKTNGYTKNELINLKESLSENMSQQSGIALIDSIIKLIDDNPS